VPEDIVVRVDEPAKTDDGFTLCTFASLTVPSSQVFLLDMRGNVVHRWNIPFRTVWPDPVHVDGRPQNFRVPVFGCHLYPNGDLLVVFHVGQVTLERGGGLARIDKDSNVLWRYEGNVHHHVHVGDDGTIYAVQHHTLQEMPRGLENIRVPALVDSLVRLSPSGKVLGEPISLLDAFWHSQYAPLLAAAMKEADAKEGISPGGSAAMPAEYEQDVLHTNFVDVVTPKLASRFPMFQPGQVFLSMRELHAIAMLDPVKKTIVWAARGPWHRQHHGELLDNGHMLIFDNQGSALGSRILEYDPLTQSFPWSYPPPDGEQFFSDSRGYCQRLPNGNTLVVDAHVLDKSQMIPTATLEGGRILEVNPAGQTVWLCEFPAILHLARRYSPNTLSFLKENQHARP
jgi:hypothetical protein